MSHHVFKFGSVRLTVEQATKALLVLNLLDAVFTSWWVYTGCATEANPVMCRALELGLVPFMTIKLLLGFGAVLTLRKHGGHWLARAGIAVALVAYCYVAVIHLSHGAMMSMSLAD